MFDEKKSLKYCIKNCKNYKICEKHDLIDKFKPWVNWMITLNKFEAKKDKNDLLEKYEEIRSYSMHNSIET